MDRNPALSDGRLSSGDEILRVSPPPVAILFLILTPGVQVNGKNMIGVSHEVAVQMLRAECEECTFVIRKKPSDVPNFHVTENNDTTSGEDAELVEEVADVPTPPQSPPPDSPFKDSEVSTLSISVEEEEEEEGLQPNPV